MRYLMPVCAGLAIIAGTMSVVQWQELRADRELISELRAKLAETEQHGVGPATVALRPTTLVTETGQAVAMAPTNPAADPGTATSRAQEFLKDPENRKSRIAQLRLSLPKNYPGLLDELTLSPEEEDRLWELLAESQLDRSANAVPMVNGQIDPQAAQERVRHLQEQQRKLEDSLAAMLGGSRFQQWEEYQETRPGRMRAMQLGQTLESSGQSLTEAQMRNLTTTLIGEQKRRQQGMFVMGTQEESNRRVVDAATGYLNARQVATLRGTLDQQINRNQPAGQ